MSFFDDLFARQRAGGKLSPEEQRKAQKQNLEDQRQRIINFKRFFGEDHGRAVMLDIMNKFHILTPLPKTAEPMELARAEGQREVVLYLLSRANMSVERLDEILKGNFV